MKYGAIMGVFRCRNFVDENFDTYFVRKAYGFNYYKNYYKISEGFFFG